MLAPHPFTKRVLFWLPLPVAGGIIVAYLIAGASVWLTILSAGLALLTSLLLVIAISQSTWTRPDLAHLETPFLLAKDRPVFERYERLSTALLKVSQRSDPIFRDIAMEHLDAVALRVDGIATGTFLFEGTETWRMIYERLLRSPGLHLYRSVAWVKSAQYWQDEPGRKSMAVNFELFEAGQLNIVRTAIIADELWPDGELWPAELLRQWLHEQYARGIEIKFVRESALANEPDLVADVGIYGSRAFGIQQLDAQCRTTRFTLTFDYAHVASAEERWRRLCVYAESFSAYLDRFEMP